MEQQEQQNKEQANPNIKQDAKGLLENIRHFLVDLVNIKDETDKDQTILDIKKDIPFKGHTVWILICSIFIASFGLNANSIPVVIGAMLISPLMGPILGIGMSLALNDIDTLKRSLVNFGVMVGISVLTATFFFWAFPLKNETSELLARTTPDIRDVLIAFFGGLALVIAKSKKGTMAGVIFGVAIATALMPPLCTAGYGIGIGKLEYTKGAMYLFLINTVFIALATFIVLKLLRFPMVKYANSLKRKRIAQLASLVAVLFMIPAVMTFVAVFKKSQVDQEYAQFLKEKIESNDDLSLYREKMNYDEKTVSMIFNGDINDATETFLRNEFKGYEHLKGFDFSIDGNSNRSTNKIIDMNDRLISKLDAAEAQNKELLSKIDELEAKLAAKEGNKPLDFLAISKEAIVPFRDLEGLSFSNELSSNFKKLDTIPTVRPVWNASITDSIANIKNVQLSTWLEEKMKIDSIKVEE